jgi:AAA15 family ATPase/GTPase
MKRIKEIKIKNFKAFQQEQSFLLNGKNLLVYGNNGSGKSSLFWALYTFLQSKTKTNLVSGGSCQRNALTTASNFTLRDSSWCRIGGISRSMPSSS